MHTSTGHTTACMLKVLHGKRWQDVYMLTLFALPLFYSCCRREVWNIIVIRIDLVAVGMTGHDTKICYAIPMSINVEADMMHTVLA